jgi:hypothetical protein
VSKPAKPRPSHPAAATPKSKPADDDDMNIMAPNFGN